MPTTKLDLYQKHKTEYKAARRPALVKVGKAQYLAIEGAGAPGTKPFTAAIGALYGIAFTVKMARKFSGREDYVVAKLEGQWWSDGGDNEDFMSAPRTAWRWKLLIRTPDFVTRKEVSDALAALVKRGKGAEADRVRLESLAEGRCVQVLHLGPYDHEGETIAAMKTFAASQGLRFHGLHHEIYLSDPRRVAPEKLKTILRMPVTE